MHAQPAVPPVPKIGPKKPLERAAVRPLAVLPTSETGVVNNVLCREVVAPDSDDAILDNMPLNILSAVINGINRGHDLGAIRETAVRLAAGQPDKADLVTALVQTHEFDRLLENMKSRAHVERLLHKACRRGDLSSVEALAFFKVMSEEIKSGLMLLKKSDSALDSITVIEKVDHHRQLAERTVQEKFVGTTDQGREILRRATYALMKRKETRSQSLN